MKILIIGSGGREHAIVWKFAQSPQVDKVFVAPGNCGMEEYAQLLDITSYDELIQFAKKENIDFTFVGPEQPLADGIVNKFEKAGLKIIGPTKAAAELEISKGFAKKFMQKYNIPTAKFMSFTEIKPALEYIFKKNYPLVIKTDGLAAGKGVYICDNYTEAETHLNHIMHLNRFGKAGEKVVVEEFLEGEEVSLFAFCDGENFVSTILSQDHKAAYDNDKGPNTGGMGAYAPAKFPTELKKFIDEKIVAPTLAAMCAEGKPYKGILYAGVMLTDSGPKVLEFNCRLGDPETQVVLPLLKTDLVDICKAILNNKISKIQLSWEDKYAVAVILASGGYPNKYETGKNITGLNDLNEDAIIFFSGVKKEQDNFYTNGGRVLAVTAFAPDLKSAQIKAYQNVEKIKFDKMHFRKDIAKKGFDSNSLYKEK
ncbi:MAG: phosphoribosylamine--glycine ligase [Candidatus Cloacimonadota bacterium]|nr:phosphoribosylamine--glycine ligase [Candidatus Cloacimonadota bacterium]